MAIAAADRKRSGVAAPAAYVELVRKQLAKPLGRKLKTVTFERVDV
ncbi:MAG TPA: hypothetical protein VFQ53_21880 [Kofleriaceae bacterium]|nr:hypothetical protein [Kofleriaceae bacterium]